MSKLITLSNLKASLQPIIEKIERMANRIVGVSGEGQYSEIFNDYTGNKAAGVYAHAEGKRANASGYAAHAEGQDTTASGIQSHAEGGYSTASEFAAHAEGYTTVASGKYSHAEGLSTIASSQAQHTQGKYNIEDSNSAYAHIVGNGEWEEERSNAHTLAWDGTAWFAGDVYVGSANGLNKDEGSKKLATEEYVNSHSGGGADWNQNDETASDYIKNRTHWAEGDGKQALLLEEKEFTFSLPSEMGEPLQGDTVLIATVFSELSNTDQLSLGDRVIVTFNGIEYECIVKLDNLYNPTFYIGNLAIARGQEGEDTGEPFYFDFYVDNVSYGNEYLMCPRIDNATTMTATFSAKIDNNIVHKIDPKYLPETSLPDWNQHDSAANDYIKNRPFYDSRVIEPDYILCKAEAIMPGLDDSGNLSSNVAYFNGGTFSRLIEGEDYYIQLLCEYPDGTVSSIFNEMVQYKPGSSYDFNSYDWYVSLEQYGSTDYVQASLTSKDATNNASIFNLNNNLKLSVYRRAATSGELVAIDKKFLPNQTQHFKTNGIGWYYIGDLKADDIENKRYWHGNAESAHGYFFVGTTFNSRTIEVVCASNMVEAKVISYGDCGTYAQNEIDALGAMRAIVEGGSKTVNGYPIYLHCTTEQETDVYIGYNILYGQYVPKDQVVLYNINSNNFFTRAYFTGMHLTAGNMDDLSMAMAAAFTRNNGKDSLLFVIQEGESAVTMGARLGDTLLSSGKIFTTGYKPTAADVTAGTFGGAVTAGSTTQDPATSLLRNTKLVDSETTPTVDGEICWLYE